MRFACFSCMSKPAVIEEDVCPAFITARHFEPSIPTSEPPLPLALDVPAAAAKCGPLQESAPALAVEKSTESEKKIEPEKVVKRKQLGPQVRHASHLGLHSCRLDASSIFGVPRSSCVPGLWLATPAASDSPPGEMQQRAGCTKVPEGSGAGFSSSAAPPVPRAFCMTSYSPTAHCLLQTSDLVTRYESYSKEREARVFKEGVQISAIRVRGPTAAGRRLSAQGHSCT